MHEKIVATIDLGSNSFHMLISSVSGISGNYQIKTLYRNKYKVQLRSGLDAKGNLSEKVQHKALECLAKFSESMLKYNVTDIKALGTYTLRKAQAYNQEFLAEASKVLGQKIEVISGLEEARLIYVGASKMANLETEQALIVDIGGGSTELVIGRGCDILELESLEMGCVSIQDQFFSDGKLSLSNFSSAIAYAKEVLQPIVKRYNSIGWQQTLGASGTIRSIASIMKAMHWSQGEISQLLLDGVCTKLMELKDVDSISLPGLRIDRENILPGGFCVLYAIFDLMDIDLMHQSNGALREGMLYEIVDEIFS
ncbi:Ppx/GppA family phosphatase [Thiotrichales bacterium 19S3-7]|nr:Ppx/GppA family phosphatase [Thiotrichales bacterium 19S3-7]MCF6801894.1 Ppx/GppA family phosphatase [Thiotrichales bacterium 19S3-11]